MEYVLTQLERYFPEEIEAFCTQHHIKSNSLGGKYNGPTIKESSRTTRENLTS